MYWRIWDLWGPANLVALWVTESGGSLSHLWMSRRDSVGPPTDSLVCGITWKMTLGRGRTQPNSLLTFWTVATHGPLWLMCVVMSDLHPCMIEYQFESPQHPQTWVMACLPCSNVEMFKLCLMLYENYMNVGEYYVVMINDNHYTCFGYFCMIRLECKPCHVNKLKMANNMLYST
jgi:hypothetical protein